MTLQTLQQEMIQAMKNKNKERKDVLSGLVGAVKRAAIDKNCPDRDNVPEELVDATLLKEQKTAQEMIDTCPQDRIETLELYKRNLEVIKEFTPQLIENEETIANMISNLLVEHGIAAVKEEKGRALKVIMPTFKGRAKMNIVSAIVNEIFK